MALNKATPFADKIKEEMVKSYEDLILNRQEANLQDMITHKKNVLTADTVNNPAMFHTTSIGSPKLVATYAKLEDLGIIEKALSILEFRYPSEGETVIIKIR